MYLLNREKKLKEYMPEVSVSPSQCFGQRETKASVHNVRLEIVVVFSFWQNSQRVVQLGQTCSLLAYPDFVQGRAAYTAGEMRMELTGKVSIAKSQHIP